MRKVEKRDQWLVVQELIGYMKEEFRKFIEMPYGTLPRSFQERIAKRMAKISYTHQSVCGNSNKEYEIKLKLSPDFPPTVELIDRRSGRRCHATTNNLYDFFDGEGVHWNGFVSWIHNDILPQISRDFDRACQAEFKKMDSDMLELSRRLMSFKVTIENAKQKLQENNKSLTEKAKTEEVIIKNIPQLQKVAQDLRNTRTFLGQSKTIKGIRENIEKVTADLWSLIYEGDPPQPWDGKGEPVWDRPPQRKKDESRLGYNSVPDNYQRPKITARNIPPRHIDPLLGKMEK